MDSAYSGEDKKSAGQTLSFFSQQIWKNEINKSHTEIRNEIINHLQKNLDRNDIVFGKSENNGISEHYVRITNSKAQTIDKWKIICSFLERRMINSSGNSYLESYRILLTLKPFFKFVVDKRHLGKREKRRNYILKTEHQRKSIMELT
ncbi:MAG: hypothetical protein AMDU2_EPLC00005G0376 [Thermoplasmatales archaeon E-plasma]|jgi:hypothetical protein|nr:MAG: hypothetical protein AMDU2_EPLC00005G0376 [Thermoplasmatales archaeon E-plasma]